ncbi:MAG: hypothetical protein OEU92_20960 [Alphaproteobacteria bacterium]|nr:hypothetical protein [Alphaproteobacteria bacterium]
MPRFSIDACRLVPSTRPTVHIADTVEEACKAALADDRWRNSATGDPDHVGHTFIAGVRESGEAGADLPIPSHFRSRHARRSDMFGELLAAIDEASLGIALPSHIHALLEKARAVRDDAADPPPLDLQTPWGEADEILVHGKGCVFYSTPSHGGIRLDERRNDEMPAEWRRADGWYEEDVHAHHVIVTFPHLFPADQVARSRHLIVKAKDRRREQEEGC